MPAHKRSLSVNATDEDTVRRRHQHHRAKQSKVEDQELEQTSSEEEEEEKEQTQKNRIVGGDNRDDDEDEAEEDEEEEEEAEEEEREDSEGSPSSSSGDKPEYVYVDLAEVRKEVQCPICLGIIKKTRTVMECLHRFCRECIDKSMRLGNNECPACRTHCASRRSLRDDPNFDALIAVLYPDIHKYEEEELAFHAEEKARNKQIQESIAEIVQRQSEACSKRRNAGKDPVSGLMPRPQRNARTPLTRRKRKNREPQESDDNEDENGNFGGAKDSSSGDEIIAQVRPRKQRKRTAARSSLPSSSVENDADVATRETRGISPALNTEMFGWGRGGTRSNTRHGASNSSGKVSRNTRIAKLVEHLRHIEESNNEMDVHFMLVSLDKESMPSLKLPHICSRPSLSVGNLCEYVAQQTHLQAQEVEILVVKGHLKANNSSQYEVVFPSATEMCQLEEEDTLARIRASYLPTMTSQLVLGYRQKKTMMATAAS